MKSESYCSHCEVTYLVSWFHPDHDGRGVDDPDDRDGDDGPPEYPDYCPFCGAQSES